METFRDYLANDLDFNDGYYEVKPKFLEWVIKIAEEVYELHDNDYHCALPEIPTLLKYIQNMNLKDLPPQEAAEQFFVDYCKNNKARQHEYLGF